LQQFAAAAPFQELILINKLRVFCGILKGAVRCAKVSG